MTGKNGPTAPACKSFQPLPWHGRFSMNIQSSVSAPAANSRLFDSSSFQGAAQSVDPGKSMRMGSDGASWVYLSTSSHPRTHRFKYPAPCFTASKVQVTHMAAGARLGAKSTVYKRWPGSQASRTSSFSKGKRLPRPQEGTGSQPLLHPSFLSVFTSSTGLADHTQWESFSA